MEKSQSDKNSSLVSGKIVSLDSEKVKIQVGEKYILLDRPLLPKNINLKDQVVISIVKEDVYEASKEKRAKDLLNEILGS